jgi:hypothetical protein
MQDNDISVPGTRLDQLGHKLEAFLDYHNHRLAELCVTFSIRPWHGPHC